MATHIADNFARESKR